MPSPRRPGGAWYPLRYTFDYELERLTSALTNIPSTLCRLVDFSMDFDFSVVYPERIRPDDAPRELVAAWDALAGLVVRAFDATCRRASAPTFTRPIAEIRVMGRPITEILAVAARMADLSTKPPFGAVHTISPGL